MTRQLRIAVVGSGISGLGAAWLLATHHDVTLFERDDRLGGHSNTVDVPGAVAGEIGPCPVDTGFIVYNLASYPNLIALFEHLAVPTTATDMGFAVSLDSGRYEYSGNGVRGLFGQPMNALDPQHWRMIADTLRFFREAPALLVNNPTPGGLTLGSYLATNGYSDAFIFRHILPMAAAIWSTPTADVMEFPAASFVRFFANHGLLQIADRPQWRTVTGGSREYVRRMLASFGGRVAMNAAVTAITRTASGVSVAHGGERSDFDACVIATHADQALALLHDADGDERRLLGAFRYAPNRAVLHTDASFMPRRKGLWSSWNYLGPRVDRGPDAQASLSVTYWMNKLQPLATGTDLFLTLNPSRPTGREIAAFDYTHPMFDQRAMAAQRDLWSLQGRRNTWFCGSYFGYGFHEDGLQSGLAAAEAIGGVRRPWTVANESGRISVGARLPWPHPGVAEAAA